MREVIVRVVQFAAWAAVIVFIVKPMLEACPLLIVFMLALLVFIYFDFSSLEQKQPSAKSAPSEATPPLPKF